MKTNVNSQFVTKSALAQATSKATSDRHIEAEHIRAVEENIEQKALAVENKVEEAAEKIENESRKEEELENTIERREQSLEDGKAFGEGIKAGREAAQEHHARKLEKKMEKIEKITAATHEEPEDKDKDKEAM